MILFCSQLKLIGCESRDHTTPQLPGDGDRQSHPISCWLRLCPPPSVSNLYAVVMAEIRTGVFAKNVQKRLNRAQEKVGAAGVFFRGGVSWGGFCGGGLRGHGRVMMEAAGPQPPNPLPGWSLRQRLLYLSIPPMTSPCLC